MPLTTALHGSEDRKRQGEPEAHATPRMAACVPVRLHLEGLPGPLAARSRDIGTGGVCVETGSPFALSSVERIVLDLPTGKMAFAAKGSWQRAPFVGDGLLTGIQFVSPKPEAIHRLWDFVQVQAKECARFLHEGSELGTLSLDDALEIALRTRVRQVPAGRWIYRQGSAGEDSVFMVLSGTVAFEMRSRRDPPIRLKPIGVGGAFGGLPLLAEISHPESALAETDTQLLEIARYTFRYLERTKPLLARCVTRALIRRQTSHLTELAERVVDRP